MDLHCTLGLSQIHIVHSVHRRRTQHTRYIYDILDLCSVLDASRIHTSCSVTSVKHSEWRIQYILSMHLFMNRRSTQYTWYIRSAHSVHPCNVLPQGMCRDYSHGCFTFITLHNYICHNFSRTLGRCHNELDDDLFL